MSMRIKAREKNLLLTCRSANKVEQVKTFKDGLRDTPKRKNYSKYQVDETERLEINSTKRCKNIRKSHSEKQMKIPIKDGMTIKESTNIGPVSINDSNEDKYKNTTHNIKRQTQNYSIKHAADNFKRSHHLNEDYEKAVRSKESNQQSDGPDRKGDSANKVIFVSLNFVDKSDKYDKRIKPSDRTKLRQHWKNIQHISSYHKKQKIGRFRKYCCRKPVIEIDNENNQSNKNDLENEKSPPRQNKTKETMRIDCKETPDEKTKSTGSHASNDSKTEYNTNKETSNEAVNEADLLDLLCEKGAHFFKNIPTITPENDVSKIDEKYLKYILLITKTEGVNILKNNENQENINKSEDRNEEIISKDKKRFNVLKVKTSLNQLKSKRIPINTPEDNNQSKDNLMQNKKKFTDDKIQSEPKPTRESIISDQRTKKRKKVIVLKLPSKKQSDHSKKTGIDHEKESGPANTKEVKNNSRKPNSKIPTQNKKESVITKPKRRGEVSEFEFIEIWRRNPGKESRDSLSSHSSADPPDNQEKSDEDSSDCEYLGIRSYQTLKKIVEEEVLKIFKSYNQKDVEKTPVTLGEETGTITVNKAQLENKVQQPADKQSTAVKDNDSVIKSDSVTQKKINLSPQKEKLPPQNQNFEKQDNELENLRVITRNSSEELNKKLKILSEQENKDFIIPSEILKNWTIMHRLEKAFLALGTPSFHNKNIPLTKSRVIGGKISNTNNEKGGAAKTKTRTGGATMENDNKTYKPSVNSPKIKISQKKSETKYLGRIDTEQKVKKSKTEKETTKGSTKDEANIQVLIHSLKSNQASSKQKSPESFNIKKQEGFSLSKDHKSKIKKRFKPDTLNRVPRNIFENNDTKRKELVIGKPIKSQKASGKQASTLVKREDESDEDYLDCNIVFSIDAEDSPVFGCNHIIEIEHNFAEEAKHFDSQIEKLLDLKSSRKLLLDRRDQNKIDDGNLERKKTFNVFPRAETTDLKSKKSKSCHKLEVNFKTNNVKCSCSNINRKCNYEYWDPFEHNNKKFLHQQYSGSETSRKKQKCFSKRKLMLKLNNSHSSKDDNYVYGKPSTYSDEDVELTNRSEFSEVRPNTEKMPIEDIHRKLLFSPKEVNLNERVVKERSILSLIQNLKKAQRKYSSETITRIPTTENSRKPNDKITADNFIERIFGSQGSQTNYSNVSDISTATYNVVGASSIDSDYPGHPSQKQLTFRRKLTSTVLPIEKVSTTTFKVVPLSRKLPLRITKPTKTQLNWERDIRQYRAIVKDIIDQYKRTKGFLKQNEELLSPLAGTKLVEFQGETPPSSNFRLVDINEYRRKIISEYRDLSIFEYKSKIQETSKAEEKKTERGLAVVKQFTPEMDYDIKDFQPNVKKVLNSEIYVDQNHFYKLKCLRVKEADQNPSLQEVRLGTGKLMTQQITLNEQSKSACIPQSNVSLPNSKVYSVLFHTPNHSKVEVDNDFVFDDIMSLSEFEETESDFTDYH